jgi:hypothetical protein
MVINKVIRDILPGKAGDFDELERHYGELQKRFYSRTDSRSHHGKPIGANCVNYLLSTLVRGLSLLEGLATALNNHNVLPAYLIVRAHYEATGALAFFVREIRKFTCNESTKDQLFDTVRKMTLGMKKLPDKSDPRHSRVPLIDNVLNYIDEVDKFIRRNSTLQKKAPFRNGYDFLSEFCHPNAYGLMVGRRIGGRIIEYEECPHFTEKHLRILLSHILISSPLFLVLFDRAWKAVTENFELPEMEK